MAKIKNRNRLKNNKFIDSALVNDATYFDYLERFKKIALSIFEWVNLPSSMNSMFLEKCLYYHGSAALLYDELNGGYINTKVCDRGKLNIYDLPTELNCYSYGYQSYRTNYVGLLYDPETNELLTDKNNEAVLVQNSWERVPTCETIELFSLRLYEAERTIDVNVKSQKTPIMLTVDESQRLMMENLYNQYNGNQPFIFGDKHQLQEGIIKAIRTDAPYVVDKLQKYKQEIFNEALTFLGINNISVEKKERLNSEEATENNELINLNLQSYLAPRQLACKQFNELMGFTGTDKEISVRVRSDLHNIIKEMQSVVTDYNKNGIDDKLEGSVNNG